MNTTFILNSLGRFSGTLEALLSGLEPDDARWRDEPNGWSILEIVGHLVDEETCDFPTRLASTLEDTQRPWAPLDPEGSVRDRKYQEARLTELIDLFRTRRHEKLEWARNLGNVDWMKTYHHPELGDIRLGDLLVSWAAHDSLHLRQIARRLYELTQRHGEPFHPGYAGLWT